MNLRNLFRKKDIAAIVAEFDRTEALHTTGGLVRNLTLRDLTALGIAAVIGAGIFSTIGNASAAGGPAVSLLFVFTALACAFSAMCYAQFASTVPVSGSAYTYAYTSFGELIAWIIGWDLLMEYCIGNIAVAISWSDYLTSFLSGFGVKMPMYLTMDYLSAARGHTAATELLAQGKTLADATPTVQDAYAAWQQAPHLGSMRVIADLPALFITMVITYLVYVGIKESKQTANLLVLLKLLVILMVIVVGAFYVQPANWSPFAPNGISGVLKGVSAVFFAYIGFDAISTTAEECKDPQHDLPKAMIYALVICTILYVTITLVLTGMVPYTELGIGDPLAYVFERLNLNIISGIVAFSAVIAMTSVLLVFQIGQPRIWMSMSRDGLLPQAFSRIHPKFKTPSFATIVSGMAVGIPALFMNLTEVTDLTSIGTLFAFVLVCGGILLIDHDQARLPGTKGFRVPYYNSKFVLPLLLLLGLVLALYFNAPGVKQFFSLGDGINSGWDVVKHRLPMYGFLVVCLVLAYYAFTRNLSLIPVLGLLTNLYLMTELGITNWSRFLLWLALGLIIYFSYSYRHSKLYQNK
ncbi:amino acid permease [Adhaeribacter pallidiroseus]|uniref:Putative amino acid permease YhdG n=1 Tax=Adhaeribacter pallidiroseus TaxID=2072847 RepID=A0A369QQ04_9BACT|nr:amino acid permease [Adhaeribacter pallidiroseus]RDC66470.1 putative amino acid permease YhdG [Adhaeribacter pallidiroseus]